MMAEFYLGHVPKAHIEQFWLQFLKVPADQRNEVLYAKWKSLAKLDDKLRFLLGLSRTGRLPQWWQTQSFDFEEPDDLYTMMVFSAHLLTLPHPEEQELRSHIRHPWALYLQKVDPSREQHFKAQLEKKKQTLLEQMELSSHLGLRNEEAKIIEKLQRTFPADGAFQQQRQTSEERKARETLLRVKKKHFQRPLAVQRQEFTSEERQWLNFLLEQVGKKAGTKVESWVLFSYIFLFMEDYESALVILDQAPRCVTVDFLKLESLIKLERYLEALPMMDELELANLDDKELLASLQLARAKALYGLNQVEVAVEILRGLTFHEPGFRESEVLLRLWEQELNL